jgi:AcrR family transcriptional regulator
MPSPNSQDARPLRADARRNYDLLVAAADAAFTERGADASLEDIARRAGVGIGTLYRHFPNREDLLAKVLNDSVAGVVARAHELRDMSPPSAALAAWLEATMRHCTTYSGLASALAASLVTTSTELGCSCQAMSSAGAMLLARAQEAGEIRRDVDIKDLMLAVNAAGWAAEKTSEPAAAQRLLTLLLDGLRGDLTGGRLQAAGRAAGCPPRLASRAETPSGSGPDRPKPDEARKKRVATGRRGNDQAARRPRRK